MLSRLLHLLFAVVRESILPGAPLLPNALIVRPGLPALSWSELQYPRSKHHQIKSTSSTRVFESKSDLPSLSSISYIPSTISVVPTSWVQTRNTPSILTSLSPKTSSPLPIRHQHTTQGKRHYKNSKMPSPSTKWRLYTATWHIPRTAFSTSQAKGQREELQY